VAVETTPDEFSSHALPPALAAVRRSGSHRLGAFAITTFFLSSVNAGWLPKTAEGVTKAGGYLGLLTALIALYASFAGVMNATAKRAILPVFPR
jgi:uncharacterized protein